MTKPIALSPSALDLFQECPRCFWLERRLGFRRPPPYPYALNAAVDHLLKQEFDIYRQKGQLHPLLAEHKIPARLFPNQKLLDEWRDNFRGIRYFDQKIGATLFGAVDDILEFETGQLAPLDYKSTGGREATIYNRFQIQMDVYTYLLIKNNYPVTNKGYLAFFVVDKNSGFENRLPFQTELKELTAEPQRAATLFEKTVALLRQQNPPPPSQNCAFCTHIARVKSYYQ